MVNRATRFDINVCSVRDNKIKDFLFASTNKTTIFLNKCCIAFVYTYAFDQLFPFYRRHLVIFFGLTALRIKQKLKTKYDVSVSMTIFIKL